MTTDQMRLGIDTTEEILEHYGVKGMKWGVRKDRGHEGERARTRKIARADKKFEKVGSKEWVAIHNRAAELSNAHDIAAINNKPKWKKAAEEGKFLTNDTKEWRLYEREHQQAFAGRVRQAAKEMGTNASGTREYKIRSEGWNWVVYVGDVQHAIDSVPEFRVKVTRNDIGEITQLQILEDGVDEILEHYGVKGMKWGVRRSRKERRAAAEARRRQPSEDFIRSRTFKKKKPYELSNKELKELNDRLTQEQRLSQLNPSTVVKGHNKVKMVLAMASTAGTLYGFTKTPNGKAALDLGKNLVDERQASKIFLENLKRI